MGVVKGLPELELTCIKSHEKLVNNEHFAIIFFGRKVTIVIGEMVNPCF